MVSSTDINIVSTLQSRWFYGNAHVQEIGSGKYNNGDTMEEHRTKIIAYMYKTFNPTSTSNTQQKRLDYWYLHKYQIAPEHDDSEITARLRDELKDLNVHFAGSAPEVNVSDKRGSVMNLIATNAAMVGELLKVSPMALFYLLAVILILT